MRPRPESDHPQYRGTGKLQNLVALITGGDSGIGRSVAIHFAREGAEVSVVYLDSHSDAEETRERVWREGRECLLIAGDIGKPAFCDRAVRETVRRFGRLDILVNNAAEQHAIDKPEEIDFRRMEKTFRTNLFSFFYLTKFALPHLREGSSIINTASVVAFKGHKQLLEYSATKGAIVTFTRSLALMLAPRKIRVNAVAPGPIWTPLIPSSFPASKTERFGANTPLERPGQPEEVAPTFVFLASTIDSSYYTGQVLHPNGGTIVA